MTEKEVIERLEDLIDTCNKGIEMHPLNEEERKSIKNLKKYIEEDGVYKKTLK